MRKFAIAILFFQIVLSYSIRALAGDADSPSPPSGGSGMVTINGLYNYLDSGEAPAAFSSFQMSTTAPGSSMHSVQDIYTSAKAKFEQCNAAPHQVLSGVKYFSTDPAHWGPQTGTATVTSCPYPASVEKTGQTTSYESGDDGALGKGVDWPNPRFTDNGNGGVTDNLTGLIWLKNANCFGMIKWVQAVRDCNTLESGECELTDGSSVGDWRLPNRKELDSLIDLGYYSPTLSNTSGAGKWVEGDLFTGVQSKSYWSSTTDAESVTYAWGVDLIIGGATISYKNFTYYVWPVRGGQ
ncbi:MAG: DUF1566 domain-containing protein [Planctomycetes bacterium]|nr:DUF1566 domain-containing protein [Planctomycetota bacterium]